MLQLAGEAGAAYAQRRQVYSTSVCAACPCYTYLSVHYHTEEGHKPLGSQSDNWFCCLDPTARRQSYLEWLGCLSDQSQPQSQHSLPRCPGCPTSSPLHEPLASQPACWHRGLHPSIRTATPKILPCQGSWRQAGSAAAHPGSAAACSAHLKQQHKINQCHSAHPIFPRMTWLQKRPDRQSRQIWSLLKTGSLIALAQMEMMHKLARLPRHRNICVIPKSYSRALGTGKRTGQEVFTELQLSALDCKFSNIRNSFQRHNGKKQRSTGNSVERNGQENISSVISAIKSQH